MYAKGHITDNLGESVDYLPNDIEKCVQLEEEINFNSNLIPNMTF